ncbi:MAG: hypothetical protein ACK2T5_17000 [Anaerolineales bacterium]
MNEFNQLTEFEEKVRQAVSTPAARPVFVRQLRKDLLQRKRKSKPRLVLKPAWALAIILLALGLVFSGPQVVRALQQLFGYIPGVGLVESNDTLRILTEPASITRDGITLTIEHVFVYEDRVELIYDVQGIDPSNDGTQAVDATDNPTAFCGGVNIGEMANHDGDAWLRLPDGSTLERDRTGLYPQNAYAMKPVFRAAIPADVMQMTLVLKCIPWARLGAVPENWEIPFELTRVPEGERIGLPVIDVQQPEIESTSEVPEMSDEPDAETEQTAEAAQSLPTVVPPSSQPTPVLPAPIVEIKLEKVVVTETNLILYISTNLQNPDPSLTSIMPKQMYVIDALGQEIQLYPSGPWQPFLHRPGSLFEYFSQIKPAAGPLTLVMEGAVLYFSPLHVAPPQATPADLTFTFDVGEAPQHGEIWSLEAQFEIAGYPFEVVSARAVTWEDVSDPDNTVGSQGYEYGYQFAIQSDPRVKLSATLALVSDQCGLWVMTPSQPERSDLLYTSLCREAYPQGELAVTVHDLAVLVEGRWQTTWDPTGN